MDKINVTVLFGGQSTEHEVSIVSASNVLSLMDENKYEVTKVGITKNGQWFLYEGNIEKIKDGSWEKEVSKKAFISPDATTGLVITDGDRVSYKKIDVVFPVLHGAYGEDGTVQGLCALAKVPCVGPAMLESAICMDKTVTKIMFAHYGIPQADWITVTRKEIEDIDSVCDRVEEKFTYPVFIKPANAGSSVGIGKSHNRDDLKKHLKNAAIYDNRILIEEFIDGQEIECAVLGNGDPIASVTGEIISANEFYDYDAKYNVESKLVIPAIVTEQKQEEIQKIAKEAYVKIGLKGLSRVDFLVHKQTKKVYLNEINTLPGFTGISMYPMLIAKSGYEGTKLIDKLIELAVDAFAE